MNVRAPTDADFDEVLALCRAADIAVYGDSDWTAGDLRDEWDDHARERVAWVLELGGRLAGYASFDDRGGGRLTGDGYVHPELRGRGVGSRIVDLYEARAQELGSGRTLESAALVGDGTAEELFRGRGYEPARVFWRMVAELSTEPPPPVWPEGIEAGPLQLTDVRAFHSALTEAFVDEWGFRAEPFEEFERRRLHAERFDPSLCLVAKDGDEIAGLALNDWKSNGDWGWIGTLAVRSAWRRRGIGEALLRASFLEFFRRGERRVALGVDAQNPTGATRLYERAGMRVLWQAVVYRKDLA